MRFARLRNVCNGGQLFNLYGITEKQLQQIIVGKKHESAYHNDAWYTGKQKAICVVNIYDQGEAIRLFRKLARRKKIIGRVAAKKLSTWNCNGAELWLIYNPGFRTNENY